MSSPKGSRDVFGITILNSRHPGIRQLKRQHPTRLHGNKSWSANYLLMDYLQDNPPPRGAQVLDAGCGWGQAGIFCAKQFQAQVLAVDADAEVFPYLELHAQCNDVRITTRQARFEALDSATLATMDYLIAADVCFWDELAGQVLELITRAVAAGIKKVILADPGRPPFWDLADYCASEYFAEIEHRQISQPRRTSGALLIIENA